MRREKNEGGPPGGRGLQEKQRKSGPRGRGEPRPYKDGRRGTQEDRLKPVLRLGHRKFRRAAVVSLGCSSRTQWPVFFRTSMVALVATSFICWPRRVPLAFSPPMARTGMVSLV